MQAMSTTSRFVAKKRDISVLYSLYNYCCPRIAQRVYSPSNDQESGPPSKRHRPESSSENKAMDNVFGDHEDFTADDLEEIDILASQAYTQVQRKVNDLHRGNELSSDQSTSTFWQPQTSGLQKNERVAPKSRNGSSSLGVEVFQPEHEALMQKLNALQDEVLVKNGEIKVLRDALRQTESDLERQKIAHVQLKREKAQLQSEKECELLKRVQSLQSELQFKDAEMNELKSKLQSVDRRTVAPQLSPKKSPSRAIKYESCSSPQPGKSSFPTKESFNASTSGKPLVPEFLLPISPLPRVKSESVLQTAVYQAKSFSSSSILHRGNRQGSVLLNILLQQSHPAASLSLCHLLSSDLGFLLGSPVRRAHSSNSSGKSSSNILSSAQCLALKNAQKLAVTGLNSIALGEDVVQSHRGLPHLNKMSRLTGAVLILPLVEFHITAYHQALQPLEKSEVSPSDNQSFSSSSTDRTTICSLEDTISSLGERALVSLGILYYLVFFSLEVVETLLHSNTEKWTQVVLNLETEQNPKTSRCEEIETNEQNLHPLFKDMISLFSSTFVTYKRDLLQEQILRVLVILAENSPTNLLIRYQGLFRSTLLLQCLSSDSPHPIAVNAVRLLAILADHPGLTSLFCSCSESCILLALYTYIISRPEKHLESLRPQVVGLLNKLITQGWRSPSSELGASCRCNKEAVKAVVLILHQKWICVRRLPLLTSTPAQDKSVQQLRETVMLLYSFFQKDKHFNEHCLDVLHQYDQAVPGVRLLLRKHNLLKESEEFALDELCPPEVEEENMDCT